MRRRTKNQYYRWLVGCVLQKCLTEIKIYHIVCGEIRSNKYILNRNASDNKHKESLSLLGTLYLERKLIALKRFMLVDIPQEHGINLFARSLSMTSFFRSIFPFQIVFQLEFDEHINFFVRFVYVNSHSRGGQQI